MVQPSQTTCWGRLAPLSLRGTLLYLFPWLEIPFFPTSGKTLYWLQEATEMMASNLRKKLNSVIPLIKQSGIGLTSVTARPKGLNDVHRFWFLCLHSLALSSLFWLQFQADFPLRFKMASKSSPNCKVPEVPGRRLLNWFQLNHMFMPEPITLAK